MLITEKCKFKAKYSTPTFTAIWPLCDMQKQEIHNYRQNSQSIMRLLFILFKLPNWLETQSNSQADNNSDPD